MNNSCIKSNERPSKTRQSNTRPSNERTSNERPSKTRQSNTRQSNERTSNERTSCIRCYFCNENHLCRGCPKETAMAPIFKKKVGIMMEHWIADNLKCLECNQACLHVIGNHSPSLDIICKNCSNKFEVKSKCLSVNNIPNDIKLPHGSYVDYVNRLEENLNLFVIIYGVDRVNKLINIREVLYADTSDLRNPSIIEVVKRHNSNLSTILIKNRRILLNLKLKTNNRMLSFKNEYESFCF